MKSTYIKSFGRRWHIVWHWQSFVVGIEGEFSFYNVHLGFFSITWIPL